MRKTSDINGRIKKSGKMLYMAAILNEKQETMGSVFIGNFISRAKPDEWLKIEPYVTGKVWDKIEIKSCKIGPAFRV